MSAPDRYPIFHAFSSEGMKNTIFAPRYFRQVRAMNSAFLNQQIAAKSHAHEFGVDPQDITNWRQF